MTATRELRSIERSIRFMETIDASNEALPTLKEGVVELREAAKLGDSEAVDSAIEEMSKAMAGMEYMGDDDEDMDLAMKSMKSAMRSMKGNAPSHDYSRDDGSYGLAMDDDSEVDDDDDDEDDDMDEGVEYVAYLESQLEEHREALRTVTSAYITSKGLNRIPQDQQASFMESIKESGQRPGEFESLTLFEEYFDIEVSKFLGEDISEHVQGPSVVNPILAEDSAIFRNIQYLSGGKSLNS